MTGTCALACKCKYRRCRWQELPWIAAWCYGQIQYTKTSWASAASQQLVLVQVSMWRSWVIGVIKFSKADANRTLFFWCCIMVISYFIHINKLLITAHPIRNLQTPASAEMNRRGVLQQVSLTLSSQSPSFFPSSQSPTPIDPCYAG